MAAAAESLRPLLEKTRELGLHLGLYNHGGWGGEPENLVAVCDHMREKLDADHVGIVYNFHHGHEHIDRFPDALERMAPYLLCVNLNGMADPATVDGLKNKIVPIGDGKHEQAMIAQLVRLGYTGPVGILDHLNEIDSKVALQANLSGLESVVGRLRSAPAKP